MIRITPGLSRIDTNNQAFSVVLLSLCSNGDCLVVYALSLTWLVLRQADERPEFCIRRTRFAIRSVDFFINYFL